MSMPQESLQDVIDSSENIARTFRDMDLEVSVWDYPGEPYEFPDEFTHWIEEQRAWRESVALIDQSFHMSHLEVTNKSSSDDNDAIRLFESLGVNSFADWKSGSPPKAKQFVAANPEGNLIGDCVLFWLKEDLFLMVGEEMSMNWVKYHAEVEDFEVGTEYVYQPIGSGGPEYFRFEIAGPYAMDVMEEVADDGLPKISFFSMDTFSINGHEVYAVGHQMTSEKGLEFFGDYKYHDEVLDELHNVGEEYDLRQVGLKAYSTTGPELAWIPLSVPAIYEHPDLQDYREWLPQESLEANFSLGGSYVSDDITDYYITLNGMGYEHIVNFDHDFVGKDAVKERMEDPDKKKVTFILDNEDVMRVNNSLFKEGDTYRFMDIPDVLYRGGMSRYDEVVKDGETVGMGRVPAYNYNEREVAVLGWVDTEYSEPGTTVNFMWGEPGTQKTQIEPHLLTDIRATVAPAPYMGRKRQEM